jgi:glucokinase
MCASLVADIGGSNSRFGLVDSVGWPERIRVIENNTVADLETAIARYLQDTGARPQTATLAIAGPIAGDEVTLTNRDWRFRRSDLANRFGFSRLQIVNDFEAIAWALPRLTAAHTRLLGPRALRHDGVKLVLGPGTGLGVAALVPADGRWCAVASEGGHASFGAHAADEEDVFARLREEYGAVSAETVLSGPGLMRLARALHRESAYRDPGAIVTDAHAGEPKAQAITRLFVRLLGRFAGGLALTFKALGGVYITGGVATNLGPLLDDPSFRAAFEAHPPYQTLLNGIPTVLVTASEPGLIGAAALARSSAELS